MNLQVGLKPISVALLSKIRISKYADYMIKRRGDSFSRCSKCDMYTTLRNAAPRGSKEQKEWALKFNKHIKAQWAARNVYWSDRIHSIDRPMEFISILHDKMDHSKTALPCLRSRTKDLDGFLKLPISVIGMYAHGHGDTRYAHYTVDVYPNDSNFTIGSLAKLLRDLEEPPKRYTRDLFKENGSNPLYEAILRGKEVCLPSLGEPMDNPRLNQDLPPTLHIQLDNCWRENKNRYAFCFWSLLVAKKIVREVIVSFMMVGHTHDDIDASFGRWSMVLKEKDHSTLPLLMKSYMDLDKDGPMIPHLIEEVPDFKKFIAPYIASGRHQKLKGHSKGSQFIFFLHENGWPLMQYKLACTDKEWKPTHIPGIKLWKEDNEGMPILPPDDAEPSAVKPRKLKHGAELLKGIDGFIAYHNKLLKAEVTPAFKAQQSHYVDYWTGIRDAIKSMGVGSLESDRGNPLKDNGGDENAETSASGESDDNEDVEESDEDEFLQTGEVHFNSNASNVEDLQQINNSNESRLHDMPLRFGFWPRTRVSIGTDVSPTSGQITLPRAPFYEGDVDSEDEPYIGTEEGRPPTPFTVVRDIRKGFFVFVRPGEGCEEPIWLGKVMENPQMNASLPNYKEFKVRWWVPNNMNSIIADAYRGWNTFPMFPYRLDHHAKTQDSISTDSVLASWKPPKGRIQFAPAMQIQFVEDNLHRIIEFERSHI